MKKVLFFSPFSEISVHAVPEAELALALQRKGNDVTLVRCRGLFRDICISMSARGVNPESHESAKQKICESCIKKGNLLYKNYNLKTKFIDDYYDEKKNKISNLFKKMSLYEFFLNKKICSQKLPQPLKIQARKYFRGAQKLCNTAPKILKNIKPKIVLTYNNFYGLNHIFSEIAKKTKAEIYTIHGGSSIPERYTSLFLHKNYKHRFLWSKLSEWKKFKTIALSLDQINKVTSHLKHLIQAKDFSVYSAPFSHKTKKEITEFLNLNPLNKTFVLLLSSGDEMFAAQECKLFSFGKKKEHSQINWLKNTIDSLIKLNTVNLVIRIHPRDLPNKRETVTSHQFKILKNFLSEYKSQNVKINWPTDNLSVHDLAKIADLCLNRTSTAGLEMMLHGVPVLQFSNLLLAYPNELNIVTTSLIDYQNKLAKFALKTPQKPNIIKLYRWIYFKNHRTCCNLNKFRIDYYINFLEEDILNAKIWKKIKFTVFSFCKNLYYSLINNDKDDIYKIAKCVIRSSPYYIEKQKNLKINPETEKRLITESLAKLLKNENSF